MFQIQHKRQDYNFTCCYITCYREKCL